MDKLLLNEMSSLQRCHGPRQILRSSVSLGPDCGCMMHHNQDSERHEVFGVKEFKKQQLQQ